MEKSFDVKALNKQIARLYEAYTELTEDGGHCIGALQSISRNIELAQTVEERNVIAVAGMQGSGKTTLVKNLYEIDEEILRISNERGEQSPVFITEDSSLKIGEYKAKRAYLESNGRVEIEDIDVDSVAKMSTKKGDTIYIELFVAQRFFDQGNSSFVLLPGFEKIDIDKFNEEYNRMMNIVLNFANSLLFVVDNQNIANNDINELIDMAKHSGFDDSNLIFAISKCDVSQNPLFKQEIKEHLIEVLTEESYKIHPNNIVCCSDGDNALENEEWIEQLGYAINSCVRDILIDKKRKYYKPIIDQIIAIVKQLDDEIKNASNQLKYSDYKSPINDHLQEYKEKYLTNIENGLNDCLAEAKNNICKKIDYTISHMDNSRLKERSFIVFKKSSKTLYENRQYVSNAINKCFYDDNGNNVYFSTIHNKICQNDFAPFGVDVSLLSDITSAPQIKQGVETTALVEKKENTNALLSYYFNEKDLIQPVNVEQKKCAQLVATGMTTYYLTNIATGEYNPDIKTSRVKKAAKDIEKRMSDIEPLKPALKASLLIPGIDLLDGVPNIISGVEALLATPAGPYVAAAAALGVIATGGILLNNHNVDLQESTNIAAQNACANELCRQRDKIISAYTNGFDNMIDTIEEIYRAKHNIGKREKCLANADLALATIKNICQDEYNIFAKEIEKEQF